MNALSISLQNFKNEIVAYSGYDEQYQNLQFLCNNLFDDLYFLNRCGLDTNKWEALQKQSNLIIQDNDFTSKIKSIIDNTLDCIGRQSPEAEIAHFLNLVV